MKTVTKQGPMRSSSSAKVIQITPDRHLQRHPPPRPPRWRKNEAQRGKAKRGVVDQHRSIAAYRRPIGARRHTRRRKAASYGMTLPIARDFASVGIRVMTIAPGTFDTPMLALLPKDAPRRARRRDPVPSRLRPAASSRPSPYNRREPELNGETIRLDGALRMAPR